MCKELEDELKTADAPAKALCEHLFRMGASNCVIPMEIPYSDGTVQKFKVTVEHLGPFNHE